MGNGIDRGGGTENRGLNRLTDRAVQTWLAGRRDGKVAAKKLADGGGLYLTLTPAGSPVWRVKYRFAGREKLHAAGVYPEVALKAARAQRDILRAQLRDGVNPSAERRRAKAAAVFAADNTFRTVAERWLERQQSSWSAIHYAKSRRALERDVFPTLGRLPIPEISPAMIAAVVQGVAARGVTETAGRILEHVGNVFEYAQALDLRKDNPATPVRQLLPKRRPVVRRAALLELEALRGILRKADVAPISPALRMANRLIAFSAIRPGNAVVAAWSWFVLDDNTPRFAIPRLLMKVKDRAHDHVVYLGPTITEELRRWRATIGGVGYLFPSPAGKRAHIGVEALDRVYSRTLNLGRVHSPHGWRAAFKTLAIEQGGFSRDATELALDHIHDTAVVRAYDRGDRRDERIRLALWWDAQLRGGEL
ncbi:MAG TPA: integrase arm-type DNA-binding domain-containing protein [Gemmatimonadaceae bacterium]